MNQQIDNNCEVNDLHAAIMQTIRKYRNTNLNDPHIANDILRLVKARTKPQSSDVVQKYSEYSTSQLMSVVKRDFNLEREDIKQLHDSKHVVTPIRTHRMAWELIERLSLTTVLLGEK